MCGRFVRHSSLELIQKTFNLDASAVDAASSYNIAPTQEVLCVSETDEGRIADTYHWGLVPFWAKDRSIGGRMINARAETAVEKPSFRHAYRRRRCLVIADGFYEWQGQKGRKIPWYIHLPSETPFGFAGLWEIWHPDSAEPYRSCTIITTAASESVRDIHHRMPAVLQPEAHAEWLDRNQQDVERINALLKDRLIGEFARRPVSPRVNNVKHNDASCIAPATPSPA